MRGTITAVRVPFHWRRWEAKETVGDHAWVVAYGITKRGALRALEQKRGR
jgi:hypothetical protein